MSLDGEVLLSHVHHALIEQGDRLREKAEAEIFSMLQRLRM